MNKLLISLLATSLICFAGQLNINYNNGTSTVIELADIASMEIVTTKPSMVKVKGGTFQMGSVGGEADERPLHSVAISTFFIGKYEVTMNEWFSVMDSSNPSIDSEYFQLPINGVSWYSVLVYCNKLSKREGLTPVYTIKGTTNPDEWGFVGEDSNKLWDAVVCNWSANGYRLPTEAEWEYAARGGNKSLGYKYAGSNDLDLVGWNSNNSNNMINAVGTKAPNELGIYDMSGNVFEWIWDWYGAYDSKPQVNPKGALSGIYRSLRSGSFYNLERCLIANRDYMPPVTSRYGFRLARSY